VSWFGRAIHRDFILLFWEDLMTFLPSTQAIRQLFEVELRDVGGGMTSAFDDGSRLFLRGVLPNWINIRRGDCIQAGVALRAVGDLVLVHPYTLRQVCTNGAIMVHAVATRGVQRMTADGSPWEIHEVGEQLRQTVRDCAHPRAFKAAASQMRAATQSEANMAISLMPLLSSLPAQTAGAVLRNVLWNFDEGRDRSSYGLMNAITATARGIQDPALRWRLEEIGGAVAARLKPSAQSSGSAMKLIGMR
jgi:hypothetical protein